MKLSKEELKKKIDEVVSDDDTKISLLEDIEDSVDTEESAENVVDKATYDEIVAKYEELKEKYKQRFLDGKEEKKETEEKDDETLEEEEVIDVKEI